MTDGSLENNSTLRQELENRFIHNDLAHPVIHTLFQLQLDKIKETEQE